LLREKLGKKNVRRAIIIACLAATIGLVVGDVIIINGRNATPPTTPKPYFPKESLEATYEGYANNLFKVSLTNNGTDGVTVERGGCSSGYCILLGPAAVSPGQNVTVEFSGVAPSGSTTFSVTTFWGNTFHWNSSSPGFNSYLVRETLILDSYDGYVPSTNVYAYWLNLTNTGPQKVYITGGSCTNTSCAAASPVIVSPNVVTPVRFASVNSCPGYITLTATTALENIFNFYVKAC